MEQQSPEAPSLALNDLVVLLNIVRVSAERGAIRAEEMSVAGAVYEKLYNFLQANKVINQPQPAVEQSSTEPESA
jgi:hypothetical protein